MAQSKDADYAQRVWEGDTSTVFEAMQQFERDGKILPYAMALYSHRGDGQIAKKLVTHGSLLLEYAKVYANSLPANQSKYTAFPNEGDCISTYLEWLSRRSDFSQDVQERYRATGLLVVQQAIIYARMLNEGQTANHTRCLLELTAARLYQNSGHTELAIKSLGNVIWTLDGYPIVDANQRVRVYAKLGMLLRMLGKTQEGIFWGVRAVFVLNVPGNVRRKAIAAFFVDR